MKEDNSINEALPTSGHSPMYVMHKFFARKQEDVIKEYIRNYSKKGEIVLDPFCGSGVMVGEALKLGRKVIGADINPVAIFVSRNTVNYVDPNKIKDEYTKIKTDIATDINGLYTTRCRECKEIIAAICFTWNNEKLTDVRYECPEHGRLISPVNEEDLVLQNKIRNHELSEFFDEKGNCRFWYPTNKLYYSDGTPFLKKERFDSVDEIFTERNLVALAKLLDRIGKIDDRDLRQAFEFAFSSMTHLASKMTPVRPSRPFSSAWVQQSYWFCPNNMESNVWNLFERAVKGKQGLIRAKRDLPENFKSKKEAKQVEQLLEKDYQFLLAQSSINALEGVKENSIDYVITDPPYGRSIQYGELLFMWGCWLRLMIDFTEIEKEEIIENPRQKKREKEYESLLHAAFKKIYRYLKPNRFCTVTFHNPSFKYRNILVRSVLMAGFELEKIIYQPPPRPSAKSLLQPFGSLEGDYFYRFKKPSQRKKVIYQPVDQTRIEELIVSITKKIISEIGEPVHYTYIQNSIDPILYEELRKQGLLMDFQPKSVEKILQKYLGEVFQLVDMDIKLIGKKRLRGKGWWLIGLKAK